MFWKEQIPKVIEYNQDKNKIEIEIIAGAYKNHIAPNPPPNSWANEKSNSVNIWKITLDEKAKFILPEVEKGISRNIYFYYGNQICINGENIDSNSMIEFQKNNSIEILSKKGLNKILLLQAKPINEPIARYGPFVMNTKRRNPNSF